MCQDQGLVRREGCRTGQMRPVALGFGLALLLAAAQAGATAIATRGPVATATPESGWVQGVLVEGGLAELNPGNATEEFLPGYQVTTRSAADDVTAQLRGSAAYALAANQPLSGAFASGLPGAFFDSFLQGQAVVAGGTPGSTVRLRLTLDFHGAFLDVTGPHDLLLQGELFVSGAQGGTAAFASDLQFSLAPGSNTVRTDLTGVAGGTPTSPAYAGALPVVVSSQASDLRGTAQINFDALVGDTLYVQAAFAGGAGPVARLGQAQAGTARVEAWGTAGLHLLLPDGTTLEQASGVLAAPGIASSVPEPTAGWLFAAGLPLLAIAIRRRPRSR